MDRVHPVAVGEREHTNLDSSSHQRPKARQTGLSLGLVFVTVVPDKEARIEKGPLRAAIARRENKTPRGNRSITALVRGGLWSTLYRLVGGDTTWGPNF